MLRAHGNAWLCFSCLRNKQKCPHVRVAEGAEGVAEQAATQLKNDVDHFLDPTTGIWRLTCLSSTKIPTMSESSSHPAMRGMRTYVLLVATCLLLFSYFNQLVLVMCAIVRFAHAISIATGLAPPSRRA